MPFRGAKILTRFSKPDQEAFAEMAAEAALTTNQLLKAGEWLADLLKISKLGLGDYLKSHPELKKILASSADRKAKGEKFFACLRQLRFPQLTEKEKEFSALSRELEGDKKGLQVEAPPFFEAEGFTVRAKIKSAKDLEQLEALLARKRKVLNSLLDIVL